MGVKFVKPTLELVEAIAADMRQADADEVWASNHHTPLESLLTSWRVSYKSVIVMVDDEPCVMIGIVIRDILSGTGVPWMLGTNQALKHKRHFIKQVPDVIDQMLDICPKLMNYVHDRNTVSIGWLKRIGFTIGDPEKYGPDGELFRKFYLERGQ